MAGSPARVADLLRQSGLRCTPQRTAVLRTLVRAGRPLSHRQLAAALGTGEIDRVTLYRALAALQEAGLVHRVQGKDAVWHFCAHSGAAAGCPGDHAHFLCTRCGAMRCLAGQPLPWVAVGRREQVLGKQFVVYGRCAACGPGTAGRG